VNKTSTALKKNTKAEDLSLDLARYMVAGLPMPDNLIDDLMKAVCEEEKQKREGSKLSSNSQTVA
jgi:hypothetical protein